MQAFAELFKRYRLRAEFKTLCEFGTALAEEGIIYENSIFTHWQNGKRIPKDRTLLLTIIKIFIQRRAILSMEQANEFLASTGLGYLTNYENQNLLSRNLSSNI